MLVYVFCFCIGLTVQHLLSLFQIERLAFFVVFFCPESFVFSLIFSLKLTWNRLVVADFRPSYPFLYKELSAC